jgi:DnaJ-class molecular chaperone
MNEPFIPGQGIQICPKCQGAGFYNYLVEIIDCEDCDGTGTINLNSEN